jgi:ligand-binding sensor domain-containing protein
MNKLILGTEQGILIYERDGDNWNESARGLTDQHITSVIVRE